MAADTPLPLTLEEHRELGLEISRTSARFRELQNLVASVYGPNSVAVFSIEKVIEALTRLQRDMEVQAAQDLPGIHVDGLYR